MATDDLAGGGREGEREGALGYILSLPAAALPRRRPDAGVEEEQSESKERTRWKPRDLLISNLTVLHNICHTNRTLMQLPSTHDLGL